MLTKEDIEFILKALNTVQLQGFSSAQKLIEVGNKLSAMLDPEPEEGEEVLQDG